MHTNSVLRFALPLLVLALVGLQATPSEAQTRFGLGTGTRSTIFGNFEGFGVVAIYVPIHTSALFIEPELGIVRVNESDGDFEETVTLFQLGTGVFTVINDAENTNVYVGGRVGLVLTKLKFSDGEGSDSDSANNFYIGPAAGAEHFFGDNFSLGAEAGLNYMSLSEDNMSVFNTVASIIARFYLN